MGRTLHSACGARFAVVRLLFIFERVCCQLVLRRWLWVRGLLHHVDVLGSRRRARAYYLLSAERQHRSVDRCHDHSRRTGSVRSHVRRQLFVQRTRVLQYDGCLRNSCSKCVACCNLSFYRASAHWRDIDIAILSVCLSVRCVLV